MKQRFRKIVDSVLSDPGENTLGRLQKSGRFAYLLAIHGGRQLIRHRAPQLAAALAYRTIFSLVPLLVLVLVVLNATFDKEAIERAFNAVFTYTGLAEIEVPVPRGDQNGLIDRGFVNGNGDGLTTPDPNAEPSDPDDQETDRDAEEPEQTVALTEYLSEFVDRAADRVTNLRFGVITVVGLAVFLYAAMSLLIQVESAFNVVTGARKGRKLYARFINYWALLTLGSILIVVSLALGQIYQTQLAELPRWLAGPLSFLGRFGATWLLLILAYTRMPTAHVHLKPAAIGATVAAVAWEGSKSGLFWFVGEMTGGQLAIYGSLAVLPVALLWIYITWFIVLFGLELAYSYQTVREVDLSRSLRGRIFEESPLVDPFTPVLLITEVARRFKEGKHADLDDIQDEIGETTEVVRRLADRLEEGGLIHKLECDVDDDAGARYSLARDPQSITVSQVLEACDGIFEPSATSRRAKRPTKLANQLRAARNRAFETRNILDLLSLSSQEPRSQESDSDES
ncbi:MAG: YihY/virulence factor BrkB family protein [Phycisphaerales bacterium]